MANTQGVKAALATVAVVALAGCGGTTTQTVTQTVTHVHTVTVTTTPLQEGNGSTLGKPTTAEARLVPITTQVLSIAAAFPLGLPRPVLAPAPPLDCGVRIGVGNLPVDFEVKVNNSSHGEVGSGRIYRNDICGFNVSPANRTGDVITVTAEFCGRPTEQSAPAVTQPAPFPSLRPWSKGRSKVPSRSRSPQSPTVPWSPYRSTGRAWGRGPVSVGA